MPWYGVSPCRSSSSSYSKPPYAIGGFSFELTIPTFAWGPRAVNVSVGLGSRHPGAGTLRAAPRSPVKQHFKVYSAWREAIGNDPKPGGLAGFLLSTIRELRAAPAHEIRGLWYKLWFPWILFYISLNSQGLSLKNLFLQALDIYGAQRRTSRLGAGWHSFAAPRGRTVDGSDASNRFDDAGINS